MTAKPTGAANSVSPRSYREGWSKSRLALEDEIFAVLDSGEPHTLQ